MRLRAMAVSFFMLASMLAAPAGSAVAAEPSCPGPAAESKAIQDAHTRLVGAAVLRGDLAAANRLPGSLTRLQFAEILAHALGWEIATIGESIPSFPDMRDKPGAQWVGALEQQGIVRGYPGGAFGPDSPVTMLQVKVMIARALRAVPDPTAANVDNALRHAGIDPSVLCTGPDNEPAVAGHAALLIDRAMSVLLYGRHAAPAGLYDSKTRTGVPEVDRVIDRVMKRGGEPFDDLIGFTDAACTTRHTSPGEVPCDPGEADGTKVNVFGIGSCSPNHVRTVELAAAAVKDVASRPLFLYAVWKTEKAGSPAYGIVLTPELHEFSAPRLYLNAEGKITAEFACGEASTVQAPEGSTYLLAPKQ